MEKLLTEISESCLHGRFEEQIHVRGPRRDAAITISFAVVSFLQFYGRPITRERLANSKMTPASSRATHNAALTVQQTVSRCISA